MDGDAQGGTLTTRPIAFEGPYLFVNADVDGGELRVEILDESDKSVPGFSRDDCVPISVDSTRQQVRWKNGADLSALKNRPVRFRFHVRNGSLYAFWVSPVMSGASHGFVAAGGPGFTGPTDTTGS
jgi:hypothetical protein